MKRALFAFIASFSLAQAQEHKLPTESKEAKNAYQQAGEPTEAFLADWDFLNKTDVVVSDGEKDATIQYPAEIQALDGKRVALIGFMAPYEKLDDMSTCMILPASVGCYFCSPPAVTQVALIQQKGGTKDKRPFINEALIVTGTLRLFTFASQHSAHQADFMYALDDATVEVITGQNKPRRAPAHLPPDPRKQPKIY